MVAIGLADLAAAESGPLQPENRLDIGWKVSRRFENLAVASDRRFPVAVQLLMFDRCTSCKTASRSMPYVRAVLPPSPPQVDPPPGVTVALAP